MRVSNSISVSDRTSRVIPGGPAVPHVLVAEDEPDVGFVVSRLIKSCLHAEVVLVENGQDALDKISQDHFHLILSDVRMPVMGGIEFYEELERLFPEMAQRFVFMTGYAGSSEAFGMIEAWGIPILHKPFGLAEIRGSLALKLSQSMGEEEQLFAA